MNRRMAAHTNCSLSIRTQNDNYPIFEHELYNVTVMENLPVGFTIVQVQAFDADKGENTQFRYVLKDTTGAFTIDPTNGWISVKEPAKLDRELNDKILLKVSVVERKPNVNPDNGEPKPTFVHVTLLDSNDNNPQFFPSNIYTFAVLETAASGTLIGSVYASDKDINENGKVIYYKQNDTISQSVPFEVFPHNGSIYVADTFDQLINKPEQFTFFVVASDLAKQHHERRTGVAIIRVNVTDINNSIPEFVGAPFDAYVGESLPEGAYVTQITATDADTVDTQLEYSIVAGNDEKMFIIDSKNGRIYTAAVLDYEVRKSYDLLVQVSDGINTAVAPLLVNLVDINDNPPAFTHEFYNFTVSLCDSIFVVNLINSVLLFFVCFRLAAAVVQIAEEMAANVTVGTISATDKDSGKNADLHYSIIGEYANSLFAIEQKTGNIKTKAKLDREVDAKVDFLVIVYDGGIPQLSGSTRVSIAIEDINDNAPFFDQSQYLLEVDEEVEPPINVFQIKAKDADAGDNAVVKYLILAGNEDKSFNINPDSGLITTAEKLNYEDKQEYKLYVAARNLRQFQGPNATNILNPSVEVVIKVKDINDESVVFDQPTYIFKIPENLPRGTLIGSVNATNPKGVGNEQVISYWIESDGKTQEMFNINPDTGEIVVIDVIDRDAPANMEVFEFKVFARDLLSINAFNTSVAVRVEVIDDNDNSPQFNEEKYGLELPESLPPGTPLPPFFRVSDIDAGTNGLIVYFRIEGSPNVTSYFNINNATGLVTLAKQLDYETRKVLEFTLLAADGGEVPRWGQAKVTISVANINEFSPKFVGLPYDFFVQENAVEGTNVGVIRAVDDDGDSIVYSLSEEDAAHFTIEPDTGRIYVRQALTGRTEYNFVARATDNGLPQNFSLGVKIAVHVQENNDYAPVFTANTYHGSVLEKHELDKVVVKVTAVDKDLQNNTITYSIVGGNEEEYFTIDPSTGEIKIVPGRGSSIDYDKKKQFSLLVQAKDSHSTPLTGLTIATINVKDTSKQTHECKWLIKRKSIISCFFFLFKQTIMHLFLARQRTA